LNPAPKFGNVRGIVRDQVLAKPLWLASVEISDAGGLLVDSGETDKTGSYAFSNLKEADYVIKVSATRHIPESKNVKIERNKTSTINFDIMPVKEEPVVPIAEFPQGGVFTQGGYGTQTLAANPLPASTATTPPASRQYPNSRVPVSDYVQVPTSTYQQPQGTEYPVPRRPRHHSYRSQPGGYSSGGGQPYSTQGYSGQGTGGTQGASINDLLIQAGGQLIQSMASKNTTSSTQASTQTQTSTSTQTGTVSQDTSQG
jgi:hypothetical protein